MYHRNAKRYANDTTNTSRDASYGLLKETVTHMLSKMEQYPFDFRVGLIGGRTASRALVNVVAQFLELDDDLEAALNADGSVLTSHEARFNEFACCKQKDVVLFALDGRMYAGRVLHHVSVIGDALTLVSKFSVRSSNDAAGYSEWEDNDERMLIETKDILDTVVYSQLHDAIAILKPCDLR